ncbi:hypothetical protein K9B33_00695 [Sphingobium sp. 3R8]|uniref:Small multidrug resistance protein n=1 Tax=Sphingomonas bisphenolicum TaxID=296544 RepID=A0ABM7FXV0_9SPHN|nr:MULTISPECIES: hypothetical protein [Sphingomonadaceae]MBZ9646053.1 hypothetical protein [Sphingobium sp. 3R8]BBF69969.1 hypothetical protein SBA_ch1_21690 [Sphingomonas bisphenolicum]
MTAGTMALFVAATLFQLAGASILPATRGMTAPWPSLAVFACYAIGLICMARLVVSGVNLSLLIPIITLAIIIGSVVVGLAIYGDSPSPMKLAWLAGAVICMGLSFTA